MKRLAAALPRALALALAFAPAAAFAEGSAQLRAARLAAADPVQLAAFYETAFGFEELRRIDGPGFVEMILRAKGAAEGAAALVLITKPKDLSLGGLPYLVLGVADLKEGIAAAEAAGGKLLRMGPGETPNHAMVSDPEGNEIELLVSK
ncbi:MAG: VOC family protein [Alphaproteobacteria bacterium]|nr:VOC family protein [Alphaproteobacteria bacterium]